MQKTEKILICCVLYKTNLSRSNTYLSLLKGYEFVFIYDNSPISMLDFSEIPVSWVYIHNPDNPGISVAYNEAAKFANENDFDWILLTDQDTFFPNNSLDYYRDGIKEKGDLPLICPMVITGTGTGTIMSPVKCKHYIPTYHSVVPPAIISLKDFGIINSGMLIRVDAFFKVGGYNSNVFLDFADYQFIERLSMRFNKAFVIPLELKQSFSNDIQDLSVKLKRFDQFCKSLKHYKTVRFSDKIYLNNVLFRRALSLTIKCKSAAPIVTLIKNLFS